MSLVSLEYYENSDLIAKDFAHIAADQIIAAQEARTLDYTLTLPLENLYRLLEMFKYGSFEDEPRSGVLALDHTEEFSVQRAQIADPHRFDRIIGALRASFAAVYPDMEQVDAINQLQESLREVAMGHALSQERANKGMRFFNHFHDVV